MIRLNIHEERIRLFPLGQQRNMSKTTTSGKKHLVFRG